MHHELLFEIGVEEIPAGYIVPALENMKKNLAAKLDGLSLPYKAIGGGATPRRLTVWVSGLAARQADRVEKIMGPPKSVAFDQNNRPTKAGEGFARTKGCAVEDMQVVSTPKGEYVMLLKEIKGDETGALLAAVLPEVIREIPFPKSMHWGAGRITFARPIQWLLALYNETVVPFQLDGTNSGGVTYGHRFMAPAAFAVRNYASYRDLLRQARVLVEPDERREAVLVEIKRAAEEAGGSILQDDELLETVSNLAEAPHAICGFFEERFLTVPAEVLITSMREHQKYFAVVDARGKLMPNFVAVNNTRVRDVKLAAEGHQRVLRARLEDALFFYNKDLAKGLAERVADLSGLIFQAGLGTVLEKSARLEQLAGLLAEELAPAQVESVRRAARLAKADLLTSMVNEFPTLQGVIGAEYARLSGESEAVATAIREHYLPLRAGSDLPKGVAGALVGLADRLDTIAGCFGLGRIPTGAADPFGLRRLAIGLLHIVEGFKLSFSLSVFIRKALELYGDKLNNPGEETVRKILEFIQGRYVNNLTSQGLPAEAVDAVVSIVFDDVVDCRRRIDALTAVSSEPAFTVLAGAFKRVRNIIKDHKDSQVDDSMLQHEAEQRLFQVYQEVARQTAPLLAAREYGQALAIILRMKEPVDGFFDQVMVMAEDEGLRANRLALLTAIAQLFLQVGDFSKMYTLSPASPSMPPCLSSVP